MSVREAGFYWVRHRAGHWLVAQWDPEWAPDGCWWVPGNECAVYEDEPELTDCPIEIDERRIVREEQEE